jgi:hypothetical protein
MIQQRFARSAWTLLAVMVFAVGCSDSDTMTGNTTGDISGANSMEELDLDLPYGGLAYTDEPEAFGDDSLLAEAVEEDVAAADEADDEEVIRRSDPELRDAPEVTRTYLRILWGNLDGLRAPEITAPDDSPAWTVWDGSLSVTEGAIAIKKTILFERPYDHLMPRVSRQAVAWHSLTLPHVDGILVCVMSRPGEDGSVPGEITFETGPLTKTFTIAELGELDETVAVDDLGNGVSFVGFTERPDACPRGFLGGLWKANEDGSGGVFRGRVTNRHGLLRGYLMGRYGINEDGERVFAGKFINRRGQILGLLQGVWEPSGEGDGMGSFLGRWAGRGGEHKGMLKGRYMTHPERPGGMFHGFWQELCTGGSEVDGEDGNG